MTFFINPGIPGRKYFRKNYKLEEDKLYYFCNKCNLIAPDELNIAHCKLCNICILSHDHHCACGYSRSSHSRRYESDACNVPGT